MTGRGRFLRGSVWSAGAVFFSMAALLAVGKLVTNAFHPQVVGVFALLLVCSDCLTLALGLGLPASMPKLAAETAGEGRRILNASVLLLQLCVVLAGAAVVLGVWALRHPLSGVIPEKWQGALALAWLLPPLFCVAAFRDLLLAMLAGMDRYASRAAAMMLAALLQAALVGAIVWHRGWGVEALMLALTAAYGCEVLLAAAAANRETGMRPSFRTAAGAVRFSAPLYANQMLNFVSQRSDTLLAGLLLGLAPAAVLEMVKRLPMMITRVLGAALTPYLPHMTRHVASGDFEAAGLLAGRTARLSAFLGYGGALCVMAVREPLIVLLFSADYLSGATVLVLLLAAAVLALQAGVSGQALIALGRGVSVTVINSAAVAAGLAANLALIPLLGLPGAGCAALCAMAANDLLQTAHLRRCGVPLPVRDALLPHAAFAAPALLMLVPGWWARPLSLAFFIAIAFALRVVGAGEIRDAAGFGKG